MMIANMMMLVRYATASDRRTIGIVCGAAALLALLLMAWGMYSTFHEKKYCTVPVRARCIREDKRYHNRNRTKHNHTEHVSSVYYVAVVEYEYNGQTYHGSFTERGIPNPGNCVGQEFDMLINPKNPLESHEVHQEYSIGGEILTGIFALCFGAVSVWLLFLQ